MTSHRPLPPTHPITMITTNDVSSRRLVPPNAEIVWVSLGTHAHPVPVFRHGTVLIYPLVQVQRRGDQDQIVELSVRLSRYLVQDEQVGLLPLVGHDFHFAYAIAQDWARALRIREVNLTDWSTVARWATAYNARTEWGTTLIRERLDPRDVAPHISDVPPNPGVPPL